MADPLFLRRGSPVAENWSAHNDLAAEVRALQRQVANLSDEVTRMRADLWAPEAKAFAFRLQSVAANTLVCRTLDEDTGDEGSTDVRIAKGYLLRNGITARNGYDYTYATTESRESDNGADTEDQVVIDPYDTGSQTYLGESVTGDIIYAVRLAKPVTLDGYSCQWLDLNASAHAWGKADES